MPTTAIWKRLYRAIDAVLAIVNLPFVWMPRTARILVGHAAIATTVLAILSANVLPVMFPRRDAITFLAEKRAALDARLSGAIGPESGAHGDADGHGKAGKDAHGAEKSAPKKDDKGHGKKSNEKKKDSHAKPSGGHH
jgi:hypothetical protein